MRTIGIGHDIQTNKRINYENPLLLYMRTHGCCSAKETILRERENYYVLLAHCCDLSVFGPASGLRVNAASGLYTLTITS